MDFKRVSFGIFQPPPHRTTHLMTSMEETSKLDDASGEVNQDIDVVCKIELSFLRAHVFFPHRKRAIKIQQHGVK